MLDFADVVAILSGVGRERVYERSGVTTKFKVIELQSIGLNVHSLDHMLMTLMYTSNRVTARLLLCLLNI
ncbi:hypothetical protein RYX36_035180 [Vicia faba]